MMGLTGTVANMFDYVIGDDDVKAGIRKRQSGSGYTGKAVAVRQLAEIDDINRIHFAFKLRMSGKVM